MALLKTTRMASQRAYDEAGIRRPKEEITMTEVHDCFSITELVTMEDLQLADEGKGVKDVLDGAFDAEGSNPCQIDGGLKCFGHQSVLRVCACFMRIICSYRAGRGRASSPIPGWA